MAKSFVPDAESKMKKSIEAFQKELSHVRTGRATPALLDGVRVENYGSVVPLKQVAAIAVPDPKSITITPWDKNLIGAVEKAIQTSDLGLNPIRDKNVIRLPIPPLNEERRKDLARQCAKIAEDAKVSVRNVRRDINEAVKKSEKAKELTEDESRKEQDAVQAATDRYIKQIDEILKTKEKEIMSV